MNWLLPLLIAFPVLTGCALVLFSKWNQKLMAEVGAWFASIVLLLAVLLVTNGVGEPVPMNRAVIAPQIVFAPKSLQFTVPGLGKNVETKWQLQLGADGFAIALVLLTAVVGFVVSLASIRLVPERQGSYVGLILMAVGCAIGAFLAMDLLTFYLFFEAILLPVVWMILGWGNPARRAHASRKFLLFTLAGSIPLVVGLIGLAFFPFEPNLAPTISIGELSDRAAIQVSRASTPSSADLVAIDSLSRLAGQQSWIFWLLMLGFGIKTAILPLHTWLPTTYRASHPTTTAILAGVVSKLGLFGFLRIVIPTLPIPCAVYAQIVLGSLGAIAIVYGGLAALGQRTLRGLLAYSSLSHMGFITLGLASLNAEGIGGAILQMVNHGLITTGVFLLCAMVESRLGMISFAESPSGLAATLPRLSVLFLFFILAGAGLPGLNGFVGEVCALAGTVQVSMVLSTLAVLGMIVGAWYGLILVQRLFFGPPAADGPSKIRDLLPVEWIGLTILAAACLGIGMWPEFLYSVVREDVAVLADVFVEIDEIPRGSAATIESIAADSGIALKDD